MRSYGRPGGEQGMLTNMYVQVREEEQVISPQFIGGRCIQVSEKEAGSIFFLPVPCALEALTVINLLV